MNRLSLIKQLKSIPALQVVFSSAVSEAQLLNIIEAYGEYCFEAGRQNKDGDYEKSMHKKPYRKPRRDKGICRR